MKLSLFLSLLTLMTFACGCDTDSEGDSASDSNAMDAGPFVDTAMECVAESDVELCAATKKCGMTKAEDRCGVTRSISCEPCVPEKICNYGTIDSARSAERFRGCTRIRGYLEILDSAENVEEAVKDIQKIDGKLQVVGLTKLAQLHFPALETVEELYISSNPSVEAISFPRLERLDQRNGVRSQIRIMNNERLRSVDFPSLYGVGYLTFDLVPSLRSVGRFQKMTAVADLSITRAHSLRFADDAFPKLMRARNISISGNSRMSSVPGFDALTEVTERLRIANNSIKEISGFNSLTEVGELRILDNPFLKEISGFSSLESGKVLCHGDMITSGHCERLENAVK